MIDLRIATSGPEETAWQAQLKEWCVAHKISMDDTLSEPEIHEGEKKVVGVAAINEFLRDYKAFMEEWYDCRCDKWMDK